MKHLKYYKPFLMVNEANESAQEIESSELQPKKKTINKPKSTKPSILVDGTSSAGKSYMTKKLQEDGWVIIGSDDFAGEKPREDCDPVKNRIQFDHAGNGPDLAAGEEFHKLMSKEREDDLGKRGGTRVGFAKHPKNKEFTGYNLVGDDRQWYMYQDYLYGRGADPKVKGVIFDDISDEIIKCFKKDGLKPPTYILLYAPLEDLKRNVIGRAEGGDARGPFVFDDQFLSRFTAKPSKGGLEPGHSYTRESIMELLNDEALQSSFEGGKLDVEKFCDDLGVTEEGKKYFIYKKNTKDKREVFSTRGKTSDHLIDELIRPKKLT